MSSLDRRGKSVYVGGHKCENMREALLKIRELVPGVVTNYYALWYAFDTKKPEFHGIPISAEEPRCEPMEVEKEIVWKPKTYTEKIHEKGTALLLPGHCTHSLGSPVWGY